MSENFTEKPGVDAISYGQSEALTLKTMEVQRVMKNKLFMALQLFADDSAPADPKPSDPGDPKPADPKPGKFQFFRLPDTLRCPPRRR